MLLLLPRPPPRPRLADCLRSDLDLDLAGAVGLLGFPLPLAAPCPPLDAEDPPRPLWAERPARAGPPSASSGLANRAFLMSTLIAKVIAGPVSSPTPHLSAPPHTRGIWRAYPWGYWDGSWLGSHYRSLWCRLGFPPFVVPPPSLSLYALIPLVFINSVKMCWMCRQIRASTLK